MTPSALVRARRATHLAFFVFGAVMATFGVQVPSIRAQYRLDDAELSIALFGVAVGAVLCLVFAGRLIAAHGHRRTCAVSALAMCAALALLLRFEHPALLGVLVVVFGACVGLFDVAINAEGSAIETAMGRKVMSQMHGLWSLGGMAGALAASAMTRVGWAPAMQTGLVALATLAGAGLACVGLLPRRAHASPAAASADSPAPASGWRQMARPTRRHVALLGALAVLGMLAEGAIYDWSVLFLQRERGAPADVAALGFAAFSAAMAAGRFGGDRLRERMPSSRLLAGSAVLAGASMTLVLLADAVPVALAGLALVGLGLSNVIPVLYIASAKLPGASAAAGLAIVSSFGWFGVVIGPPLVGSLAQATSLTLGLGMVVAAAAALAVCAPRVSDAPPPRMPYKPASPLPETDA